MHASRRFNILRRVFERRRHLLLLTAPVESPRRGACHTNRHQAGARQGVNLEARKDAPSSSCTANVSMICTLRTSLNGPVLAAIGCKAPMMRDNRSRIWSSIGVLLIGRSPSLHRAASCARASSRRPGGRGHTRARVLQSDEWCEKDAPGHCAAQPPGRRCKHCKSAQRTRASPLAPNKKRAAQTRRKALPPSVLAARSVVLTSAAGATDTYEPFTWATPHLEVGPRRYGQCLRGPLAPLVSGMSILYIHISESQG